jgi:hypothetical protein
MFKVEKVKQEVLSEQAMLLSGHILQKESQLQLDMIDFARIQSQDQLKRAQEEAILKEKEILLEMERDKFLKYERVVINLI